MVSRRPGKASSNAGLGGHVRFVACDATKLAVAAPVILITHVMPDALAVTDRIIVMHRGRKVAEKITGRTNAEELVQYMVGAREDATA
jgi:ABC-type sugar transport system ATPase subunit